MRFQKIYIEISNICNLQCTFCPEVERDKKIMSAENFKIILPKVLPYTDQICLHLMGEPLAHPEFKEILDICNFYKAKLNLTTNGTFLNKYGFETFFNSPALHQINFSVHSFKDNFPGQDIRPYLFDILQFSKMALTEKPELYINYRLWNLPGVTTTRDENQDVIDHICEYFQMPINERIDVGFKKSKNIIGRVYFHFDTRFEWPSLLSPSRGELGFCHALSQQIGIHANGTVVPCCLDKEAGIPLGNLFEQDLEEIFQSKRCQSMKQGFEKHRLVEDLCQKCTYIKRFDKKVVELRK
ncbi:MAG: radical SAM/SPASM domain-containing protein [Bacteriovoracaceae bacterium]|jgi:radical SAM protein with 4Fe4S-binding SPASM domain